MKQTLTILNLLVENGVVERYAIGGAMGATFYTEPFTTFDLDVFVFLPKAHGPLVDMEPIFASLRELGYAEFVGECIMIEGVPVRFLPTTPGLLDEALAMAGTVDYDGVPTRVLGPEYLLAIHGNTRPTARRGNGIRWRMPARPARDCEIFFAFLSRARDPSERAGQPSRSLGAHRGMVRQSASAAARAPA